MLHYDPDKNFYDPDNQIFNIPPSSKLSKRKDPYPELSDLPDLATNRARAIAAFPEKRPLGNLRRTLTSLSRGNYNLEASLAYTRGVMAEEGEDCSCMGRSGERGAKKRGPYPQCGKLAGHLTGASGTSCMLS